MDNKVSLVELARIVDAAHLGESEAFNLVANAFRIADNAARSDIELYSHQCEVKEDGGYWIYSTTETMRLTATMTDSERRTQPHAATLGEALEALAITIRAADYIRGRGNVFSWRMVDVPDMPGWVRFVDKEGRPVDPGRSETTHNNRSHNEAIEVAP